VDNALRLLMLFRDTPRVRLSEASGHLGVAHSTAHRLMAMLAYHGFVRQEPGSDFDIREGALRFDRPLQKEGKVAWWRWLIGAFGVGTYRRDDQVDVRYEVDGHPQVAHALDIEPPAGAG